MPSHYLLTACLLSMCDHVVLSYIVRCTRRTLYVMRHTYCTLYNVPPYRYMVAPLYGSPDKMGQARRSSVILLPLFPFYSFPFSEGLAAVPQFANSSL